MQRGFTLIEIMAVVIIIGLMLGLVLPNMAASRASRLRQQAMEVASRIELARERAIITGAEHRVVVDLDEGGYRVEWYVTEERAGGIPDDEEDDFITPEPDYSASTPISLEPPTAEVRDFYPIPNRFGGDEWLAETYFFEGIDTPEGFVNAGFVHIGFERDGTADYSRVALADQWENVIYLEVEPLMQQVRIYQDE
jgi:prepilin-type N-terminal cleavage/methylation domain-containing protein